MNNPPAYDTNASLLFLLLVAHVGMTEFTSQPRWGQAAALVNNLLFVYGGKTDEYNAYSYTSAPTTNDLLLLDLSESFDPSSPPWQYISGSSNASLPQGQELAWHTLSAYNTTQLLLFGGDGGPNSPIVLPTQSNSAELLDVNAAESPVWINESEEWAGEPSRRIHHATASSGGRIFLIGGEKDDGSSIGYSDHYVFDPSEPSFTKLPSNNGPSDIYGHASVVLSDGRLLVFGGYSESNSLLIPLTTIWSMDTTQSALSWSSESVSNSAVPTARRAFASTWLEGDKVLIQGGSDADFQTSYSDGWILDTTTSPMTWSNVSALAELGARRDHFAVQVGSQVLFGFGYGTNAGASVVISIFDCSNNVFTSSFAPQSAPSHTTLPAPSGTSGSYPGSPQGSGSGGTSGSGSNPTANPTDGSQPTGTAGADPESSSGSGGNDEHKHDTAVIAVASVLSIFALTAIVAFVVIIIVRRKHSQERFHPLQDSDPDSPSAVSPHGVAGIAIIPWFRTRLEPFRGEKVRMAEQAEGWTVLGLGRRNANAEAPRMRIDMLANEDASEYADVDPLRRFGSGSSKSWYSINGAPSGHERYASAGSGRPSIGRLLSNSLGSLRSMGAGVRRVISGGHARQRTDVSLPLDSFDVDEISKGLLLQDKGDRYATEEFGTVQLDGAIAARPREGHLGSPDVSRYSDPFHVQDELDSILDKPVPADESVHLGRVDRSPGPELDSPNDDARSSHSTLPRSSVAPQLPPLTTMASKSSSEDPSSSSLLSSSNGGHTASIRSQQAATALSLSTSSSARPRTTSIIGSVAAPMHPVKRSDSWWTRFKRSSMRDSTYDQIKSPLSKLGLDFRDPNPPPGRLGAIKEASGSSAGVFEPLNSTQSGSTSRGEKNDIYSTSGHERSTTSLKTSRTADSTALERLAGRVDVAQREATETSIDYVPSMADSTQRSHGSWPSAGEREHAERRPSSPATPDRSQDIVDGAAFIDINEPREIMQSPTEATFLLSKHSPVVSDIRAVSTPVPLSTMAKGKRLVPNGAVAARVAEYERRLTLEMPSPMSPTRPRAVRERSKTLDGTAVGEQKAYARRKTVSVKYGLVYRPELFVANPDRHSLNGSSDS